MRRLSDWLKIEASGSGMWKLILICGLANCVYSILPLVIFGGRWPNVYVHGWTLLIPLTISAFVEEFFFRFLPIAVIGRFTSSIKVFLFAMIVSAAIFGFMHGGLMSLLVQGVGGLLLGLLFLKCGGLHGHRVKAWMAASIAHALINFFRFVFFALAFLG